MSIEKKSLISTLKTTKKANVAASESIPKASKMSSPKLPVKSGAPKLPVKAGAPKLPIKSGAPKMI